MDGKKISIGTHAGPSEDHRLKVSRRTLFRTCTRIRRSSCPNFGLRSVAERVIKIDDPVFWSKLLKEGQEPSLDQLYVSGGGAMIAGETALEEILKKVTDVFIHGILSR